MVQLIWAILKVTQGYYWIIQYKYIVRNGKFIIFPTCGKLCKTRRFFF